MVQAVGIIAFIAEMVTHATGTFEKGGRRLDVADVARRQHQRLGTTDDVGERMDLRGPTARSLAPSAPFCAECGTLDLDIRTVDRGTLGHYAGVDQCSE
jgi:hypothetical protein